jgi:hypothetical protein
MKMKEEETNFVSRREESAAARSNSQSKQLWQR